MKKKLLTILAFAACTLAAQAGTTLFSTDFSTTTGVAWSTSGADLTNSLSSNGDYNTWLTATSYCYYSNAGSFTFPTLNFTGTDTLTICWGSHDGRSIELLNGSTSLTSFSTQADKMDTSVYALGSSITGSQSLSLNIAEGSLVITNIKITSGSTSGISSAKASTFSAYGVSGGICVKNLAGKSIRLYDVTGNLISTPTIDNDIATIPVASAGIYVVASEGNFMKVVVK